jgi:hypothetical protein
MFRGIGSGIGMRLGTKVVLCAAALAVVGTLYVFSREPSGPPVDECSAKGIDPEEKKVGTCKDDGTENVVVNPSEELELATLDARLERIREHPAPAPKGSHRRRELVTFDLAVTNRTDAPETFGQSQFLLAVRRVYGPDIEAESRSGDSLQTRSNPVGPGETVAGTVAFDLPPGDARHLHVVGDFDIGNFGTGSADFEPEALFGASELGIIRTEKDR